MWSGSRAVYTPTKTIAGNETLKFSSRIAGIGSIGKGIIHRRRRQLHQELSEPFHQRVHEPKTFIGRGSAGIADTGVRGDQVPRARDADPAAVDRLETARTSLALISQLQVDQLG